MNHAILSAVHQERGAHRAFEIDMEHDSDDASSRAWIRRLAEQNCEARVLGRYSIDSIDSIDD